MKLWKVILVSINVALVSATCEKIKYPQNDVLELYSVCEIKLLDKSIGRGICTKLSECFEIDFQIRETNYNNHTVCGYEGTDQIVCCPWETLYSPRLLKYILPEIGVTLIDLETNFQCKIKSNGQNGVLKFIEDCPELNGDINAGAQDFCNHEVCENLVCCPLGSTTLRYNPVCQKADRPDTEIMFRLNMNMPCTVKGLNATGTYQTRCNAYSRNEISLDNVFVICLNEICSPYYCCPVLNSSDKKHCTRREKQQFPRIDFIGPTCTDSLTKLPGRCRNLIDCPAYNDERYEFDECGKDCCTDFYCCPDENYVFQSVSMEKCFGYRSTVSRKQVEIKTLYEMEPPNTQCSVVYQPHAGGIRAIPGAFPYMAALGYVSKDSSKLLWNCGGSLISEKYILTAAHCLVPEQFGQVKTIRLGSLYLDNETKSDECAEDFGVKRVIPHPMYNRLHVYNDIGIIELDREVIFNFHMRPICLPSSPEVPYNLIGMGWGLLGPSGEKSETLYYGYLETYTYEECNKSYAFNLNRRVLNGIDDETQLCVGSRETIQSACTGDSGGPIMANIEEFNRMDQIHGITSFGTVCGFANSPGVYTKVYPFMKWIESVIWSLNISKIK